MYGFVDWERSRGEGGVRRLVRHCVMAFSFDDDDDDDDDDDNDDDDNDVDDDESLFQGVIYLAARALWLC